MQSASPIKKLYPVSGCCQEREVDWRSFEVGCKKKTQAEKEKSLREDDLKMEAETRVMCLLTFKRRMEKDLSQNL